MSDPILVVDDEQAVLNSVRRTLRTSGFDEVLICADPLSVMPLLEGGPVSLILLDLVMPALSGRELLEKIVTAFPEIPVVVVTAEQDARTAVDCMKAGAYDYLLKPASAEELLATVRRALDHRELREENSRLRSTLLHQELTHPEVFAAIITLDPAMHRVFSYLEVVARGSNPVLITGESGSGKELMARALHELSGRRGPFVAVNVAGLDDAMFSDTLFGHKAGAFTGASMPRRGMAEIASGGTLFLDEIGDLGESSQVKLLRLLQEKEYYPLGSETPKLLDARVVAATHQDPAKLRRDLFFRLRAYMVRIPPLRDRVGDLPLLVERFVNEAAKDLGKAPPQVPERLYRVLSRYDFPGNVRELRALVFDSVARHLNGPLPLDAFAEALGMASGDDADGVVPSEFLDKQIFSDPAWRELEKANLLNALRRTNWKISGKGGAADLLAVRPSTLESRMRAFRIEKPR
ncbi:MAG: sigma-54-dependent Fis family transcriptional regulator [Thermoanaerobaculia bacterium]|nr:sigma-54-dependent Fis family transcriptional regulator [Thermoanaerobaculia bacterium]